MCDCHAESDPSGQTSRRDLLRATGILGVAGLITAGGLARPTAAKAGPAFGSAGASGSTGSAGGAAPGWVGTSLVLLGTSGGPLPLIGRCMTSQAVVVDGAAYLVDCGSGVVNQMYRAGLTHHMLRSLFITHFHADHVSDYLPLMLFGRPIGGFGYGYDAPMNIYGPASFGLPPGTPPAGVQMVNPGNPHPGMVDVHHGALAGFATTVNGQYIKSAMGPDVRDFLVPHDVPVPADPVGTAPPRMSPFTVMEDERVRVTATLASHYWPFPAYAFRFDTDHGSITFSGDTSPSDNVIELARGTDLLVHEIMDGQGMLDHGVPEGMVRGLRSVHTDISEIGAIASAAGARTLVLSHIVPLDLTSPTPPPIPVAQWRARISRDYRGNVVVGEDLAVLSI